VDWAIGIAFIVFAASTAFALYESRLSGSSVLIAAWAAVEAVVTVLGAVYLGKAAIGFRRARPSK
jgi:hypothetical protein